MFYPWFMINLLPPEYKKEVQIEETRRLVMVLGLVVLFTLFCFIIILIFLKIYLLIQIDFQRSSLELIKKQAETSEAQVIMGKIRDSNKTFARINDFYEQKFNLEEALEKLAQTIPEGIYLTNLSYSKDSSQIILAGFSPSRDLLVQFKKNLEQREEFQEIYFPTSSWIKPANIDFAGVKITFSQ